VAHGMTVFEDLHVRGHYPRCDERDLPPALRRENIELSIDRDAGGVWIRVDDRENPAFWLQFRLPVEMLVKLLVAEPNV